VQHVVNAPKRKPTDFAAQTEFWQPGGHIGPFKLGVSGPAAESQGRPRPYITPGLEKELGDALADQAQFQPASANTIPTGAAFNPSGPVYGAEPGASSVTLKARKPASVVLRSPDGGTVYFAKQLATGEAYRAPLNCANQVLDVSDAAAFEVYYNGEYHGGLAANVTPCGQLNSKAADFAAQAQARAAKADTTPTDDSGPAGDSQQPGV
jgi:hypothetical protein